MLIDKANLQAFIKSNHPRMDGVQFGHAGTVSSDGASLLFVPFKEPAPPEGFFPFAMSKKGADYLGKSPAPTYTDIPEGMKIESIPWLEKPDKVVPPEEHKKFAAVFDAEVMVSVLQGLLRANKIRKGSDRTPVVLIGHETTEAMIVAPFGEMQQANKGLFGLVMQMRLSREHGDEYTVSVLGHDRSTADPVPEPAE